MNIRFSHAFQTFPSAVQNFPAAVSRVDSRTRLIASGIAIVVAIALVWYFTGLSSSPNARGIAAPPVNVARAQQKTMTVVEHTIGTVVANSTVQITARVQGQLMSAGFKEGDIVHTGDLLFQIDPRPYRTTYDNAIASLASSKAKAERYGRLLTQHAIAPQDADDAKAAYLEAKANVEAARLNLEYTQIRSPIDGKTGSILIQPGNLITANSGTSNSGSNALVVITQVQPVKVSFFLPQADLPRIQDRLRAHALTASIDLHDARNSRIEAPIDFVGNAVSAQTGTIELRATFPNADLRLVPGQLLDVVVALNTLPRAIVVPREAVNLGPSDRYVYVVTPQGNADMREVTVLFDDGTNMAVKGRIKPGDKVITDGQLRVLPGKPVAIVKPGARTKGGKPTDAS